MTFVGTCVDAFGATQDDLVAPFAWSLWLEPQVFSHCGRRLVNQNVAEESFCESRFASRNSGASKRPRSERSRVVSVRTPEQEMVEGGRRYPQGAEPRELPGDLAPVTVCDPGFRQKLMGLKPPLRNGPHRGSSRRPLQIR